MRAILALAALLSMSVAAAAETTLLARVEYTGHSPSGFDITPPAGVPDSTYHPPAPFFLYAGSQDGGFSRMEVPATSENYGKTFSADPGVLAEFNTILTGTSPSALIIGSDYPYIFDADDVFSGCRYLSVTCEVFVPQRGPSFSGYNLDAVKMTVGYPQVVELYGHAVPEPATWAVALLGITALCLGRVRRKSVAFSS